MSGLRSLISALSDLLDLVIVVGVTLVLNVIVFVPLSQASISRLLLGFVFVCFIPGYALISALYPEDTQVAARTNDLGKSQVDLNTSGLNTVERFVLAVGLSFIIVPLVGFTFNFTDRGISLEPILLALSSGTIIVTVVAAVRRLRLSPQRRFQIPVLDPIATAVPAITTGDRTTRMANVLVVIAIACFVITAGYAVSLQSSTEGYSELSLVTSGSNQISVNNSSVLTAGSEHTVSVSISNHENQDINYTIAVFQQTVRRDSGEIAVQSQRRLDTYSITIRHNETRVVENAISPESVPGDSRVVWLLYVGDAPSSPSTDNADYYVYLWVTDSATK